MDTNEMFARYKEKGYLDRYSFSIIAKRLNLDISYFDERPPINFDFTGIMIMALIQRIEELEKEKDIESNKIWVVHFFRTDKYGAKGRHTYKTVAKSCKEAPTKWLTQSSNKDLLDEIYPEETPK